MRTANQLAARLMDVPSGAAASTSAFDANRTPSLDEFSKGYYGTPGSDHLRRLGVTAVAHEGWSATHGNKAEVVLFLFGDARAASAWMVAETSALSDAGAMDATLAGLADVVGYMFTQYGNGGLQDRRYYAIRGRIGLTFNFFTPPGSGPGQAPDWVGAQYRRLG